MRMVLKMKKYIKGKILFICIFLLCIIIAWLWWYITQEKSYEYENKDFYKPDYSQVIKILPEEKITYERASSLDDHMENAAYRIIEDDDLVFFKDFYDWFTDLNEYYQYKQYAKKFPELLPVIYAVRLKQKDEYIKFYSFIYDKIEEEWIYMDDIIGLVGDVPEDEVKVKFLEILWSHYESIIGWGFMYSSDFWDGPIHIALSENTFDEVKQFCDTSFISGLNPDTKRECYDYARQYRAQNEWDCEAVESLYQKRVCKWFFKYISY